MSNNNWKVVELPDGSFDLKELDNVELAEPAIKMDYESGKTPPEEPPYNCRIGLHDWKWYEGLMERYWYCTRCDKKDRAKTPPPRKIR